jgi:hypothetical protein
MAYYIHKANFSCQNSIFVMTAMSDQNPDPDGTTLVWLPVRICIEVKSWTLQKH